MVRGGIGEALEMMRAAVDLLLDIDRTRLDDTALTDEKVEFERLRRRIEAIDVAQTAELDRRGLAGVRCYPNTASFLVDLLRVSPGEAKGRVARAVDLGPRRDITGAPLAPIFPAVAQAQRAGDISVEHIRVIASCLDKIPSGVQADELAHAERFLVEQARHLDARRLGAVANRLLATIDPDGAEPREDEQQRRRGVNVVGASDGSFVLSGRVTAEFVATWNPIFDTLAAPVPSDDGIADDRTAAHRRHDAMIEAGQRLLRSGKLPDCGGVPVTVVVAMSESQLRERSGTATTEHGDPIAVQAVLDQATEAEIVPVVLDDSGGVVSYGRTRRVASPGQRRALFQRDGGCCFPGCTRWDPLRRPVRNTAHHLPELDIGKAA